MWTSYVEGAYPFKEAHPSVLVIASSIANNDSDRGREKNGALLVNILCAGGPL